jgi:FemAB-related protein (PEP-CTERM system-associated)
MSHTSITVMETDPVREDDRLAWDRYVAGHPLGTGYHAAGWRRVLEEAYGFRTNYLAARRAERVVGVLPLARVRKPLGGATLCSLPFSSYGGVLADDQEVADCLLEHAAEMAQAERVRQIELRHLEPRPFDLSTSSHKVTMWLDLPPSEEAAWSRLPSKIRTDVRRRIKDGLKVRLGGPEHLDIFYDIFARNMRDLGTPVYPRRFFASVLANWSGSSWIAVCTRGPDPVAAGLLLGFGSRLEIPWSSSLREARPLRPNVLLYWECIRHAVASGFSVFDFGRSTRGHGTHTFKRAWGPREVPLAWQYWLTNPRTRVARNDPGNPRFALAIAVWKCLPLFVTNRLGPALARYFP